MYGSDWTAERVINRLVAAFRAMPGRGVYSPSPSVLLPAYGSQVDGEGLVAATADCLGRDSLARVQLLTYASAQANGRTITDLCRELGWPRRSFDRHRDLAAEAVACWLNCRHLAASAGGAPLTVAKMAAKSEGSI